MKKLFVLLIISLTLSCEKEDRFCSNPVIESESEMMIMRTDFGKHCGYNHSFYVYLVDQEKKAVLLTNEDHGFPFQLKGNNIIHRSVYTKGEGLLVESYLLIN